MLWRKVKRNEEAELPLPSPAETGKPMKAPRPVGYASFLLNAAMVRPYVLNVPSFPSYSHSNLGQSAYESSSHSTSA